LRNRNAQSNYGEAYSIKLNHFLEDGLSLFDNKLSQFKDYITERINNPNITPNLEALKLIYPDLESEDFSIELTPSILQSMRQTLGIPEVPQVPQVSQNISRNIQQVPQVPQIPLVTTNLQANLTAINNVADPLVVLRLHSGAN